MTAELPTVGDLRDVAVTRTYKVRVSRSLAIGGFTSMAQARRFFLARGFALSELTITPETNLVLR